MSITKFNIKTVSYLITAISLAATLTGCFATNQETGIESVFTNIKHCKTHTDPTDPNSTAYKLCPGVAGYQLIVRKMGAGRKSIEVITDAEVSYPLDYQDLVTKGMFHIGDRAEWRIAKDSAQARPLALIVEIHAHDDLDQPERVTTTYLALAKLSAAEICVTDVIVQGTLPAQQIDELALDAQHKPCLSGLAN